MWRHFVTLTFNVSTLKSIFVSRMKCSTHPPPANVPRLNSCRMESFITEFCYSVITSVKKVMFLPL